MVQESGVASDHRVVVLRFSKRAGSDLALPVGSTSVAPSNPPVTTFKLGKVAWGNFCISALAVLVLLRMLDAGELAPPVSALSGLLHLALAVYLAFWVSAHFNSHVLEQAPVPAYVELYQAFCNMV